MCVGCGARAIEALSRGQERARELAREAQLRELPNYHRVIHVSEYGITGIGIITLKALPGVSITQKRIGGRIKYRIELDSRDDYEMVLGLIQEHVPARARAEAARVYGVKPEQVERIKQALLRKAAMRR